ncbi:MAG TPA: tRNA 2-thiouridine(34) synthase MnmA [Candidatus Cloacimonadota bacterium]|mgnify:FL=1|nr:tRNA 2-thiouridine(34) synthase MnmA [Candidatus Cloacimonadota bacterium]
MIYAVAMSGGVDSSIAALLLKEQGHHVIGFTMYHFNDRTFPFQQGTLSKAVEDAQNVAKSLGIEHYTIDLQKEFNDIVINDFINQYKKGLTPNPCTLCNPTIKWGAFLNKISDIMCEKYDSSDYIIATGHYAKKAMIGQKSAIFRPSDIKKDQTYMLWQLSQKQVEQSLFPLTDFTKEQIRAMAHKANLPVAQSKDSQDICFIDKDYHTFLNNYISAKEGNIILPDGTIIGKHNGLIYYTIGQRKGLVPWTKPLYVMKIDSKANTLIVTDDPTMLESKTFKIHQINLIREDLPLHATNLRVKVRYHSPDEEVQSLHFQDDILTVELKKPVSAISPGQSAVFYRDDELVGGGVILPFD